MGEQFYGFRGLRRYKEKFGPRWRPKYLACSGGLAMAWAMLDIIALVSGKVSQVPGFRKS
jgi:phosphatidylglycerol lysyltransferase